MSIILKSGASSDLAKVDANGALAVNLPIDVDQSGFVKVLDGHGDHTATTENESLKVSQDSLLFFEQVEGAVLNTNVWNSAITTMAIAQTASFITLNSGSITTINTNARIESVKQISFYSDEPVSMRLNAKVTTLPEANATIEFGFGFVSAAAAPTDGAMFRWNSAGNFVCVINNAGVETVSASISGSYTNADGDTITMPPPQNVVHLYEIIVVEDLVRFFVDDALVAEVLCPNSQGFPVSAGRLPVFARVINGGTTPTVAPQLSIGQIIVTQQVVNQNKLWKEMLVSLGRGSYQSPVTAFGQTASIVNGVAPVTNVPAAATAAYTALGGRYQFAALAGAATDLILFAYTVPTGFQLFITGISITMINTVVAVGAGPEIFEWQIGVNSSAVTLATVDAAGPPPTWAARRTALGIQSFPAAAAVGASVPDIVRTFDPPLVVDSGRVCHIILNHPVGLATATEIFRGTVGINGYFE